MKLYCINLKRSQDRRMKMESEFSGLPFEYEFIDATDGRALSDSKRSECYSKWRTRFRYGKGLTNGEIGCALSHIEFFKRVIGGQTPAFVFEDDVSFGDGFTEALAKAYQFLSESHDPSLVRLPGLDRDLPCKSNEKGDLIEIDTAAGTYAYGINSRAAKLLLKEFAPIKMPIDHYKYLVRHCGLRCYAMQEKVVAVDMDSDSTIGAQRFKGMGWVLGFYKLWRVVGIAIDNALS